MASIGDLVVGLKVNTTGFNTGISKSARQASQFGKNVELVQSPIKRMGDAAVATANRVKRAFSRLAAAPRQFGRSVRGAINSVGGVGTAIAGLAGGALTINGIKNKMAELDATGKLATRTGFGTDTIAALGFAAEQSGGDVAGMNKALDAYNRRIGGAADGTGPAADTLRQLGLSVASVTSMQPDEQLLAISQAISELPSKAAQADAAFQLFGRSGLDVVNVFAMGREGVGAFIDEAKGLGLGFDASEIAKVEAANDAMNRITRAMGAVTSQLAIKLAPAIESVFTKMLDFGKSMSDVSSTASMVTTFVADAWTWTQNAIAKGITATMALGEFAMTNWQEIGVYAFTYVQLSAVQFFESLKHFFTATLPAVFSWFGQNWRDIFHTAVDFALTAMINVGKNIRNLWTAVVDFIAGKGFNFEFTPLLDGFRNTISKMPDIPERALTEMEKRLQTNLDGIGNRIGTSFDDIVGERMRTLDDMQKQAAKGIPKQPKPPKPINPRGGDKNKPAGGRIAEQAKQATEVKFAGTMQRGSDAAITAVLKAQMTRNNPQVKAADKTTKAVKQAAKAIVGAVKQSGPVIETQGAV